MSGKKDEMTDIGVTKEEIEEIRQLFILYDRDGDGLLGEEDMKYVLETMYMFEPTNEEARSAIKLMIPHHEGRYVDFKSFLWYKTHDKIMKRKHNSSRDMLESFNFLDRDGDGFLGYDDLLGMFKLIGMKRTHKQIEDTIEEADSDGDGKISFEDFKNTLASFIPRKLAKLGLRGLCSNADFSKKMH